MVTSFGILNFSGMLFNRGNTRTPFSTLIAPRGRTTNAVEFTTGLQFTSAGGTQPNISETASLTAPAIATLARTQNTNVTQIFQETVGVSYGKESNMGTLSGLNVAGQTANPINELDFQVAGAMNKIARDIEFTFLNGVHVRATTDAIANRTRGIMTAITSNVVNLGGAALRIWDVAEAIRLIYNAQGSTNGLVLWVDPVAMFQLNADAEQNGTTIVPASRDVNGLSISTLLTPLGEIGLYLGEFLPAGTVGVFNPDVIARVEQPHPEKGNFFMEELAITGAGKRFQIFGQLGLDHGPEWMHARIIGINTAFVRPPAGSRVFAVDPIQMIRVLPSIIIVMQSTNPVVGTPTGALALTYNGAPETAPTLAYQWQIGASAGGSFADIGGATGATYTPIAGNLAQFIRVRVTATGTAQGVIFSDARVVA